MNFSWDPTLSDVCTHQVIRLEVLVFFNAENKVLISGDVLFQNSIGRSDLPLGDHETLLQSIHQKLMTLPDDVKVFSGHGPSTSIGQERRNNPFLQ